MADWQDHRQQGWDPNKGPITVPPTMPLMTPYESEIPLTQPGVPYGQSRTLVQSETPIQIQPGGYPMPNINCPPGLEQLMTLDRLMVDLRWALCEATTYDVKDSQGLVIYSATRDVSCDDLFSCQNNRLNDLRILDEAEREVIYLHRLVDCCTCKLPEIEVFSKGVILGSVIQNWRSCGVSYSARDASGDIVFNIERPGWTCDPNFVIFTSDGEHKVGRMTRKSTLITGQIDISFPRDLDVKMKAVLLGTWFLINVLAKD